MRLCFLGLLLALLLSGCSVRSVEDAVTESQPVQVRGTDLRQPVLVELFTSEGCSSCPPADRQLTFLETQQPIAGAGIVTLAFHVDYWDRLGWKDAFSSAEYSDRQNSYTVAKNLDSNYTPQMIVDGEREFVGSDASKASDAISKAAQVQKGVVELAVNGSKAEIAVRQLPKHEAATAYLIVAEDNIETNVRAGENSGKMLSYTSVVRQLKEIGMVAAGDSNYEKSVELPTNPAWKKENLKYVAFVQENTSRRIIAVGKTRAEAK